VAQITGRLRFNCARFAAPRAGPPGDRGAKTPLRGCQGVAPSGAALRSQHHIEATSGQTQGAGFALKVNRVSPLI
jgi:hypothetical protein